MVAFLELLGSVWESRASRLCFCVVGVMSTLIVYGVMQVLLAYVLLPFCEFTQKERVAM
jgi:hypothetical protein